MVSEITEEALLTVPSLDCWIIDSGATCHITPNRNLFLNYRQTHPNHTVRGINKKSLQVSGIGDI